MNTKQTRFTKKKEKTNFLYCFILLGFLFKCTEKSKNGIVHR